MLLAGHLLAHPRIVGGGDRVGDAQRRREEGAERIDQRPEAVLEADRRGDDEIGERGQADLRDRVAQTRAGEASERRVRRSWATTWRVSIRSDGNDAWVPVTSPANRRVGVSGA